MSTFAHAWQGLWLESLEAISLARKGAALHPPGPEESTPRGRDSAVTLASIDSVVTLDALGTARDADIDHDVERSTVSCP